MSNECDIINSYTLQKWSATSPSLKSLQQDLPFSDQSSSNIPPLSPKNLSSLTTLLPVTSPSKCDTPIDKRTQGSPTKSLPSSTSSHFSTNNGNSSKHALSHGPSQPTSKSSPSRSVIPLMTNSDADYESMQDCDLQHVVDPPILDTNQLTFSGSSSSEMHHINELVHVPVLAPPTTIQTRLKNNIFKPKNFFSLTTTKHSIPPSLEPTTTTEALKHKEWRDTMCEELDALKKMAHGNWCLLQLIKMLSDANGSFE